MSSELQIYRGYTEEDIALLRDFKREDVAPEDGFIKDFIGVRTRATSVYAGARSLANTVCDLPVPADYHAEAIEWIGALKSVRAAQGRYRVMELGAGYGTWCIAMAHAARGRGIDDIRIVAVEGDPDHFLTMKQHFRDNAFDPAEHVLLRAAVGAQAGTARWPKVADSSDTWGLRPMQEESRDYTGQIHTDFVDVDVIPLAELIVREPVWDLVHIDVQGHEVEICRSCLDLLTERVRWMVVGLHSRKLDGDMLDMFAAAGWVLEHEKPTRFVFQAGADSLEAMTHFDGTQVWRNPRL